MLRYYHRLFSNLLKVLDVGIFFASFVVVLYLTGGLNGFNAFDIAMQMVQWKSFIVAYWLVWFYLAFEWKVYHSKRISSIKEEMRVDIMASAISFAAGLAVWGPSFAADQNKEVPYLFELINICGLICFRNFLRRVLRFIRSKGFNYRNILIVGRNQRSAALIERVMAEEEFGLKVVGYLDDPQTAPAGIHFPETVRHLGDLHELHALLNRHVVDEVHVFLPIKSFYEKIEQVVEICADRGVVVRIAADLFSFAPSLRDAHKDLLELLPVLSGFDNPYKIFAKRCIDLAVSLCLLVLLIPLLLAVSLLIKLDSPGPVFFVQERVGCNNRRFRLVKFRTMVADADRRKSELAHLNEMDGPVFKMRKDPRVTRVGRKLRIWSLDELPQLLNVLTGSMSLVGPRPPLVEEVEKYALAQRRRLSVKPGITGLWQINGRNSVAFDEWVKLDLKYIDNWTLSLDLQIMFKTIWAVLSRRGAM